MRAMLAELMRDIRYSKHYFFGSILIFAIGLYAGYTQESLHSLMLSQIAGIQQIAQTIDKLHLNHWQTELMYFTFIFFNNIFKALMFIFFGAFFGLFPFYSLLMNGMVMGFLFEHTAAQGGSLTREIVLGILPHGVIELPAIFLASAYGLRLGVLMMKGMASLLSPGYRTSVKIQIVHFFRMTVPLTLVLGVALLAAAIIESTVTYNLTR